MHAREPAATAAVSLPLSVQAPGDASLVTSVRSPYLGIAFEVLARAAFTEHPGQVGQLVTWTAGQPEVELAMGTAMGVAEIRFHGLGRGARAPRSAGTDQVAGISLAPLPREQSSDALLPRRVRRAWSMRDPRRAAAVIGDPRSSHAPRRTLRGRRDDSGAPSPWTPLLFGPHPLALRRPPIDAPKIGPVAAKV